MSKKIANVLNAAADYVADAGWCRNAYFDPRGRACLAGAIGIATGHLRPLSVKERTKRLSWLEPGELADALNGKGEYADLEVWTWSNNKAKKQVFNNAVNALAATVDTDKITRVLADFDEDTQQVLNDPEKYRITDLESYLKSREITRQGLSLDLVTSHNDEITHTERGEKTVRVGKTTKASAVKLLRTAANAAS